MYIINDGGVRLYYTNINTPRYFLIASSQKQLWDRHVPPLEHIIPISSQPTFALTH